MRLNVSRKIWSSASGAATVDLGVRAGDQHNRAQQRRMPEEDRRDLADHAARQLLGRQAGVR